MRRTGLEALVNANRNKTVGNHRVEILKDDKRNFILYTTVICRVDDKNKTFSVDDSYGTQTTKKAVNWYRNYFTELDYVEVAYEI